MKNKKKSISSTLFNYLLLTSSIVITCFLVVIIIFETNKFKSDSENLKQQIYKEKQIHVKNQVKSAIKMVDILRDSLKERMRDDLRREIDIAYDIAVNLYNTHKGKFTDKQIQYLIQESLRPVRFFNGRGYFFILDKNGYNYLHPVDVELERTKVALIQDADGAYPIAEIINNSMTQDSGFVDYSWLLPGSKTGFAHKKTSYYRNLPFYNWIIGTGDYLEFQEDEVKHLVAKKFKEISYDEYGYIYVYDLDGNVISTQNEAISQIKSFKNFKDADGRLLFPLMIKAAFNEKDSFFTYRLYSEQKDEIRTKQAYVALIPDWQWMVGGFTDLDSIEIIIANNKTALYSKLFITSILIFLFLVFLIILIFFISKRLKRRLEIAFSNFHNQFEVAVNNQSLILSDKSDFLEKDSFVEGINSLLKLNNENLYRLQTAKEELSILNVSKDRFFSIIAHDLKNPFNSLIGILEILLEDYDDLNDKERKEYLQILSNSTSKLFNLLTDLLNWARLQTYSIDCVITDCSILNIINKEVSLLYDQSRSKNIVINIDIEEDVRVSCDGNMISTVVRNIISNSIKFTNIGGQIKIYSQINKQKLTVYIEDNGLGMSEGTLSKLFKIEEKITSVGTNQEIGTGLGLILCKEFIELNKGTISVKSELGKGTVFSFSLSISI